MYWRRPLRRQVAGWKNPEWKVKSEKLKVESVKLKVEVALCGKFPHSSQRHHLSSSWLRVGLIGQTLGPLSFSSMSRQQHTPALNDGRRSPIKWAGRHDPTDEQRSFMESSGRVDNGFGHHLDSVQIEPK